MANDGWLLGPNAKKDLAALRFRYIRRMPNAGQARHRRDLSVVAADAGVPGNCGCTHSNGSCDCPDDCWDLRMPAINCPDIPIVLGFHANMPAKRLRLDTTGTLYITPAPGGCQQVGSYLGGYSGSGGVYQLMTATLNQSGTTKTLCLTWWSQVVGAPMYSAKYAMCQFGCSGPFYFDLVLGWKTTTGPGISTTGTACDHDGSYDSLGAIDSTFCWPDELILVAVDCDCTDYYGGGGSSSGPCADDYPTTNCLFEADGTNWNVNVNNCGAGCGCDWTQADIIALFGPPTLGAMGEAWCV